MLGRFEEAIESCERGMAWEWDGVHFEMLSPDAGAAGLSDNDGSCVLLVSAVSRLQGPLIDGLNAARPGAWWGYSMLFFMGALGIALSAWVLGKVRA